jgi:hypothetical protein
MSYQQRCARTGTGAAFAPGVDVERGIMDPSGGSTQPRALLPRGRCPRARVTRPTDSRTAPLARAAPSPIAASTPLTASCSEWQAEPTDAANRVGHCRQEGATADARERDMQGVRQPALRIAVEAKPGYSGTARVAHAAGRAANAADRKGPAEPSAANAAAAPIATISRHVLGTGPQAVLLLSAVQHGPDRRAGAHVQRADALWARRTCGRPRSSRSTPSSSTFSGTLPADCAASVCSRMPRSRVQACDLGNRLQRAHLVVGMHHRDQGRVGPQSRGQLVGRRSDRTGRRAAQSASNPDRASGAQAP